MAVTFEVKPHGIRPGVQVVEILVDGEVAAIIYPDKEKGIRLVSAHIEEVVEDDGSENMPPIPTVLITFDPRPYTIVGNRIVKHPRE